MAGLQGLGRDSGMLSVPRLLGCLDLLGCRMQIVGNYMPPVDQTVKLLEFHSQVLTHFLPC